MTDLYNSQEDSQEEEGPEAPRSLAERLAEGFAGSTGLERPAAPHETDDYGGHVEMTAWQGVA